MRIATARFGEIQIADNSVLVFPEGLPGFEGKEYALIKREESPAIEWLISISDAETSLMVLDPSGLGLAYDPKPKPAELTPIDADSPDTKLDCRVVIRKGEAPGTAYLNLFAPIMINFSKNLAMQVPLVGSGYAVREVWPRASAT